MTAHPHLHHLVEAMLHDRVINRSGCCHYGFEGVWPTMAAAFPAMPYFVLREDLDAYSDPALIYTALDLQGAERMTLPYPNLLIEGHLRLPPEEGGGVANFIVHAAEARGQIVFSVFVADNTEPETWVGGFGYGVVLPGERGIRIISLPREDAETYGECRMWVVSAGALLMAFLSLLDSPVLETQRVDPPPKLNRARVKRGKAPLSAYREIRLRLPRTRTERAVSGCDGRHRASPRVHWRRGHDREYRPGFFTKIPVTVVAHHEGDDMPPPPLFDVTVTPKR